MTILRILVLGGTGHYGREIVRSLVEKGASVRVLTRDAERARRTLGDGPEFVEGDITVGDCVREALQGISGLVIAVSAFAPDQIKRIKAVEQDAVIAVQARLDLSDLQKTFCFTSTTLELEASRRFYKP